MANYLIFVAITSITTISIISYFNMTINTYHYYYGYHYYYYDYKLLQETFSVYMGDLFLSSQRLGKGLPFASAA